MSKCIFNENTNEQTDHVDQFNAKPTPYVSHIEETNQHKKSEQIISLIETLNVSNVFMFLLTRYNSIK